MELFYKEIVASKMVICFVYFFGRHGEKRCHCFEDGEQQARHFASLVGGEIVLEIDGHIVFKSGN